MSDENEKEEIFIKKGNNVYVLVPFRVREQWTVEKPRLRTVLLDDEPTRLAFPWVVRKEYITWSPAAKTFVGQWAWVSPDAPTWDSPAYQHPLTWHVTQRDWDDDGGHTVTTEVQDLSHYAQNGSVCYNLPLEAEDDFGAKLWNSNHTKWDKKWVKEWSRLSKLDVKEATAFAVRKDMGTYGVLRSFPEAEFYIDGEQVQGRRITDLPPLGVGANAWVREGVAYTYRFKKKEGVLPPKKKPKLDTIAIPKPKPIKLSFPAFVNLEVLKEDE